MPYHFDTDYSEKHELSDGSNIVLRLVGAQDKPILRAGFERLSDESRYMRFLGVRDSLTDHELRYLTEVDDVNHLAIGAVRPRRGAVDEGLGLARFIRLPDHPTVAEPAIAVVDELHGHGLGTLLLQRLAAAAAERGIERFRVEFLADNRPIRHLIDSLVGDDVQLLDLGEGVISADLPVPNTTHADLNPKAVRGSHAHSVLIDAAKGVINGQMRLGRMVLKMGGDHSPASG